MKEGGFYCTGWFIIVFLAEVSHVRVGGAVELDQLCSNETVHGLNACRPIHAHVNSFFGNHVFERR